MKKPIWFGYTQDARSGTYAEKTIKTFAHTVMLETGNNCMKNYIVEISEVDSPSLPTEQSQ